MKRRTINKPRLNLKEPRLTIIDIHLIFKFAQRQRFKYSTGKKIKVKYWDKKERLAKENLKCPESRENK